MLKIFYRHQRGMTLLELIVAVSIVGILMAIGVPQLGDWLRRSSIRSAAEVVQNGLRIAEGEAIRRNAFVEFLLTNSTPDVSGIKSLTAVADGKNWAARVLDSSYAPLADVNLAYVGSAVMSEFAADLKFEGPANVVFNGNGRVTDITGVAITDSQIFRLSRPGTGAVCVFVTPGGAVKACDPALASGHPFACLPLVPLSKCPKI